MTIRSHRSQDIDLDLRWNITELGHKALRDIGSTGFSYGGNPVSLNELVFRHPRRCDWCGNPATFSIGNLKTPHGRHHFCDSARCLVYRRLVDWAETRD